MKYKIIGSVIALLIGSSVLQYYFGPRQTITKIKEVIKFKEVVQRDIEIVEKKDGTKITKIKERIETDKETDKSSVRSVTPIDKKWLIGGSYSLSNSNEIGLHLSRRIIGDIYVGAYATTNKEYGVSVTFQF